MDVAKYAAALGEISNVEEQVAALEALSEQLEGAPAAVLPAVLSLMERLAGQDDFGLMHPFGDWMEELDGAEVVDGQSVGERVVASLSRAMNWKVLEVSSGLLYDESIDRPSAVWFDGIQAALARPGITEEEADMIRDALADYA